MKLIPWIFLCLIECSCSASCKIYIPKPPCLNPLVDFDFTLCKPFVYYVDGVKYKVPQGFTTDLASTPRVLWSIYAPHKANTIPAAIIHDYMYFCPTGMSRARADSIFYDALIYKHVRTLTAFKYWLGVKVFGALHFNDNAACIYTKSRINNSNGYYRMRAVDHA